MAKSGGGDQRLAGAEKLNPGDEAQPGTPGSWSSNATAYGNSCACPGARTKATARPMASVITQALVP